MPWNESAFVRVIAELCAHKGILFRMLQLNNAIAKSTFQLEGNTIKEVNMGGKSPT